MEPLVEMPRMAAYGVEQTSWNGLPWSWAAERLVANRNFWVVTVSSDGWPHALPVWGVWDPGSNTFAFSCAPDAKKLRNIAANPHVSVAVDDTVECVSIEGTARILAPGDAAREPWIARYAEKYGAEVPGDLAEFMRGHAIVEVVPTVGFGIIEREDDFATRATRWRFAR